MNPKNGLFCGTETKSHGLSDEYTEPVYVDDKVPEQVESNREILLQILENQCVLLLAAIQNDQMMDHGEPSTLRLHLAKTRKRTVEILEKERRREDDPRKS